MRAQTLAALAALALALSPLAAQESPQVEPAADQTATVAADQATAAADQPAAAADQPAAAADQSAASGEPAAAANGTAAADQAAPAAESPAETPPLGEPSVEAQAAPAAGDEAQPSAGDEAAAAALKAEIERLGGELEKANAVIDELRNQAQDLKAKAAAAEELAKAERAAADAAVNAQAAATLESGNAIQKAREEAESAKAQADQAAAKVAELEGKADAHERQAAALETEAAALKTKVAELESKIAELQAAREAKAAALSSWGGLRLDSKAYPELLRKGFGGATKRMGTWKIADGVAAQTDGKQYFSRLSFPLVQSAKPTLYSFDVKEGAAGWVGAGLHFFAEGVKKPKGYGEGRSLLVWLTRDAKNRGDRETYLQIYRSDDDVNMERVLDAEIKEGVAAWNHVDILYEPGPEFVVIAVNGSVRAAYRTFFGIGTGVSVSLRTLGPGVAFRNFEIRR